MSIKIDNLYPLTPMQQGMLFLSLDAVAGIYCEQVICEIKEVVRHQEFVDAWQRVVDRYAILRTAFIWEEVNEPLQLVLSEVKLPFQEQDWTGLSATEQRANLVTWLNEDRCRGFQLAEAPLLRLALLRLSEQSYQFVLSFHHLLLDGWSIPIVLREVFLFYEALCRGEDINLGASRPYGDFIVWLRKQDLSRAEAYWRKTLAGFRVPTRLSVKRPYVLQVAGDGSSHSEQQLRLSEEMTEELQALARQHQVTLNTIMQGAWALLLSRYSGETDVVFGTVVSGRPAELSGVEAMVGLFINTLPVRVKIRPEEELGQWLKQIQRQQIDLLEHEYSPLVKVQGWSEVARGEDLFQSILIFENYPLLDSLYKTSAGTWRPRIRSLQLTNYPIHIAVEPGPRLLIDVTFDHHQFHDSTVAKIVADFETLLTSMIEQRTATVSQLMLHHWNTNNANTEHLVDRPFLAHDRSFQLLFEEQVARSPEAIAVVSDEGRLTYSELHLLASRLARHLIKHGVRQDVPVGILAKRGNKLLTAVLATFKAGAAYLPLDLLHPINRHCQILTQSRCNIVLMGKECQSVGSELKSVVTSGAPLQVLVIDELLQQEPDEVDSFPYVTPDSLAYIVFTSGSTGVPKGAMIEHGGMLNHLLAKIADLELTSKDVVAQTASQCFDISVWQLLAALLVGGCVHIVNDDVAADPARLLADVDRNRLSILEMVPSLLRRLVSEVTRVECRPAMKTLRWLIITGDTLLPELCRVWFGYYSHIGMMNAYGPTECSDDVTHYRIPYAPELDILHMPIGRPVSGMRVYVMDTNMQQVATGISGELYISGIGVGRGYVNDPVRTAQVFVPDPLSSKPGGRLYRTGDFGRCSPDGDIEFLRRLDHQVKIRGFRVELGEIETKLRQHPAVQDVAVAAREEIQGERRLVAYVVLREKSTLNSNELRNYAREALPGYMAPSVFMILDELPLTPNGKLNRAALPASPTVRPQMVEAFVAPCSPTEKTLAQIWAEVLKLDRVGLHDNFFELGGDSILSIQVFARANQMGIKLSPRQLLRYQTIAELAAVAQTSVLVPVKEGEVVGPVPLTPIQCWFFEEIPPEPHHWNMSVLLSLRSEFEPKLLEQAVEYVSLYHDALRLRFEHAEAGWQQFNMGIEPRHNIFAIFKTDIMSSRGESLETAAAELQVSLNLSKGPLIRSALFDHGPARPKQLLLIIHHLVTDGVSWRILLEDLYTVYSQLKRGEVTQLPPKSSSFQQWSQRLAEYSHSEAVKAEASYWLAVVDADIAPLPVDYPGEIGTEGEGRSVTVSLDADETWTLLHEVLGVYRSSIKEILLTALVESLWRWSGQTQHRIALEGHGRDSIFEDIDLSRTVGWFTALFPVVLERRGTDNIESILSAVKQQLREVPNYGLGYGLLRYLDKGDIARRLTKYPRPEVSFNYLGRFDLLFSGSSPFMLAQEFCGPDQHPQGVRRHLLEINGVIIEDQLQMIWTYSENVHERHTIERLAQKFMAVLRVLITGCQSAEVRSYTPADFPKATLDQLALDRIVARIQNTQGDSTQ